MAIFCPNCLKEWSENNNKEKIKSNGLQCKYCKTFYVNLKVIEQVLKDNHYELNLQNIGDVEDV